MAMETNNENKKTRAKKRVEELKGFYIHLMVYIFINTMIIIVKIVGTIYNGENFMGPLLHFSTFTTPILWGIGLAFHALKVFGLNPFLGKGWEQRQIQKYIEEDRKEVEKYKQKDDGYGK
jgi:hypothetical protein